jgi:hypothetical protein
MANDLTFAQEAAYRLAGTLMVPVVLIRTDLGYGILELAEFDGDPESIICEYDPFAAGAKN